MNSNQILSTIKQLICEEDPTAEVYLFGPRATGTHREDSGWDLLILVDNTVAVDKAEDQFRDVLYDLELASGEIISIFVYAKGYWQEALRFSPLYAHVHQEGKQLQ